MFGYKIYLDSGSQKLLDDTTDPERSNHVRSWTVVLGDASEIDSCTLEIYVNHPEYSNIRLQSYIYVYDLRSRKDIFYGRVLQMNSRMDSNGMLYKEVVCEGAKAFLKDSVQFYRTEKECSVSEWISDLLDRHNSMVDANRKIKVGSISISGAESKEKFYTDCEITYDCLQAIVDKFGGEMIVRTTSKENHYLDYQDHFGQNQNTEIALSDNLISMEFKTDIGDVITRLYPLGAVIQKEKKKEESKDDDTEDKDNADESVAPAAESNTGTAEDKKPEKRYGIADVNGGINFIEDAAGIAAYGRLSGIVTWDDITDPEKLLARSRKWLGRQKIYESITADVLDLSIIFSDYATLNRFDSYIVSNPLLGIRQWMRISKITISSDSLHKPQIVFGDKARSLSAAVLQAEKTARRLSKRIDETLSEIEIEPKEDPDELPKET